MEPGENPDILAGLDAVKSVDKLGIDFQSRIGRRWAAADSFELRRMTGQPGTNSEVPAKSDIETPSELSRICPLVPTSRSRYSPKNF